MLTLWHLIVLLNLSSIKVDADPFHDHNQHATSNNGYVTSFVVNGQTVKEGEVPWLVALFDLSKTPPKFFCGGALISYKMIITAAHCIQEKGTFSTRAPDDITVHAGRFNIAKSYEENAQSLRVQKIVVHENWSSNIDSDYGSDIATLITKSEINFSKNVKPIPLPTEEETKKLKLIDKGIITGWGSKENSPIDKLESTPRMATIEIINWLNCYKNDPRVGNKSSTSSFCGIGMNGSGACMGDSGSPLVIKLGTKWVLSGIISAGLILDRKCSVKSGAVYTNISEFTNWIQNNARKNGLRLSTMTKVPEKNQSFSTFWILIVVLSLFFCCVFRLQFALILDISDISTNLVNFIQNCNYKELVETTKNLSNLPSYRDMCPQSW